MRRSCSASVLVGGRKQCHGFPTTEKNWRAVLARARGTFGGGGACQRQGFGPVSIFLTDEAVNALPLLLAWPSANSSAEISR